MMQIKRCPTERCYTTFVSLFRLQRRFGFCWDDWFLNSHFLGMLYAYFDYGVSHSLGYLDSSIIMISYLYHIWWIFWEFLLGFWSYVLTYGPLKYFLLGPLYIFIFYILKLKQSAGYFIECCICSAVLFFGTFGCKTTQLDIVCTLTICLVFN